MFLLNFVINFYIKTEHLKVQYMDKNKQQQSYFNKSLCGMDRAFLFSLQFWVLILVWDI